MDRKLGWLDRELAGVRGLQHMNNDILSIVLWISTGGFGLLAGVFGVATTKRRMTAGEADYTAREKSIIKVG